MAEYIEREAAFNAILKLIPKVDDDGYCWVIRGSAATAIDSIPAADVRPVVKATWIVKEMKALFPGMDEHPVFACSECGYQIYDLLDNVKERHHFCSNCGAAIEVGDEKA